MRNLSALSRAVLGALALLGCSEAFTVVVLPDTQYYSCRGDSTYAKQAQWIVSNRRGRDIRHVIHLGDVVENEWDVEEWEIASNAHRVLDDARIPYSVLPGNHDLPIIPGRHGLASRGRLTTRYNDFFGPARFASPAPPHRIGSFPTGTSDNNASVFSAAGLEFLVIALEHAPRKEAMCWASDLLERNPNRRAIVATHCYSVPGGRVPNCDTSSGIVGAAGPQLWEELISRHPQIFMVLSGHYPGVGRKVLDRSNLGWDPVHEILIDHQAEWRPIEAGERDCAVIRTPNSKDHHGNGWLSTFRFRPERNQIRVQAHSALSEPLFKKVAADPSSPAHDYRLQYDMENPIRGAGDPTPTLRRFSDRHVHGLPAHNPAEPDVGRAPRGESIVVWSDKSGTAGGPHWILAKGLDENGCDSFPTQVVTSHAARVTGARVGVDANGGFVVVWERHELDGSRQLRMRGFEPGGNERFPERAVGAGTGLQAEPAIAMTPAGEFVIAWEQETDPGGSLAIEASGFHADGTERISQRTVSGAPAGQQRLPDVEIDGSGNFVVVWQSDDDGDAIFQVHARGFRSSGLERVPRQIIASGHGSQIDPAVGMSSDGDFFVVWEDPRKGEVKARGFDPLGAERLSERIVNQRPLGRNEVKPAGAVDGAGSWFVAWSYWHPTTGFQSDEIMGRGFDIHGAEILSEDLVHRNTRGPQIAAAVSIDASRRPIVVWQDDVERDGEWNIMATGCSFEGGCR